MDDDKKPKSTPISKKGKIVKTTRQKCSCTECRKSKKKCDGESPCGRCIAKGKECIFVPHSRRPRKKRAPITPKKEKAETPLSSDTTLALSTDHDYFPVPPSASLESALSQKSSATRYISLFLDNIHKLHSVFQLDRETLLEPTTPSLTLQSYCALATASRALGEKHTYLQYERKARELATDLLDDFTVPTAKGFSLFSFYLWGEDTEKALHYAETTVSLCKRIETRDPTNSTAIALRNITFPIRSGETAPPLETSSTPSLLEDICYLSTSYALFHNLLLKDPLNPFPSLNGESTFNSFLDQENQEILRKYDMRYVAATSRLWKLDNTEQSLIHAGFNAMRKAVIFHVIGRASESEMFMKHAIALIDPVVEHLPFVSPLLIHCCHLGFVVCFETRDVLTARKIVTYMKTISRILVSTKNVYEADVRFLYQLESEIYSEEPIFYECDPLPNTIWDQLIDSETHIPMGVTDYSIPSLDPMPVTNSLLFPGEGDANFLDSLGISQ